MPNIDTKERAKYWGTSLRTMQIMVKDGVRVDSDEAVVDWFANLKPRGQAMLLPAFREKIYAVQSQLNGEGVPDRGENDGDEIESFESTYVPAAADKDNLAQQKKIRDFYQWRWERARKRKDRAGEAEALKHYGRLSDLIHDCELRAQRLGRDMGESFSAEDVKRLGVSVGYWLMHGADQLISQMATALTAATANGAIDRETVRRTIEPLILAERVAAPMQRAVGINAGVALPAAFVESVRAGLAMVVEETPCAESPR